MGAKRFNCPSTSLYPDSANFFLAPYTGVEQHVLRYWESEFTKLNPRKNRAGNRQYREKDISIIRYIKHLLHNDMYTVQGAKKKLAESGYKEVEGQLNLLAPIQPIKVISKAELKAKTKKLKKDSTDEEGNSHSKPGVDPLIIEGIKKELQAVLKLLK